MTPDNGPYVAQGRCPRCGARVGPHMVQITVAGETWHLTCYERGPVCTCPVAIIDAMGDADLLDPRCPRHG